MPNDMKCGPKGALRFFLALLLILSLCLTLFSGCGSEPDEPAPTAQPTAAPDPEPREIVNPVNGPSPEDINDTLRNLSENGGLAPSEDGYVYTDEEGDVTITVTDPAEVRDALENQPASGEEGAPSVVTGVIGNTEYIAITSDGNVTVYITVGDQTVKAKAETRDGQADAKAVKKAASVAGSVANASKVKEPYERGRDDYDHNKAAYYMDAADCLIFYPAQLTKKTAFEDQSVIFSDARSSVTCSARLEFNPYKDIDELESLMKNTPNNTVLGWGDNWLTSEHIKDGMVTYTYVGFGKKYMVTEEICYPRKYSFVFDELRELMSVRFLEGSKWVNGNRKPRPKPEYGAPAYGLQECFYPEFELFLVIPDTLREMSVQENRITFHDDHRNSDVTLELFEIPESQQDNLFQIFHVVAKDGDIVLGDDYVHWHNSYGMYLGAMSGSTAALMRFEGGDAFTAYEAVYDELICQLVDQFFEPQPLSGGKKPAQEPLEPQPTGEPEASYEPQPTSGPEVTPEPQPSYEPQPTAAPGKPARKKATPKTEPNKIDEVVEKQVTEKAKEDYPPAPDFGNDPLEYYSDADCRAVNTSLEDYVDLYPLEEEMILSVILKVLAYNGYAEAEWVDAGELMLDLATLMEDIDDALFEFRLFGTDTRLPEDLFPYVCEALYMDWIPDYRVRPESDPPAPEWLEDWRQYEEFREEDLDWDEVRRLLDLDEPIPDPYEAIYENAYPGLYYTDGTWTYDPEEPDDPYDPDWPDGPEEPDGPAPGTIDVEAKSWPEYGLYFDEETVRELAEQTESDFFYYLDLAWQENHEYWDNSSIHGYGEIILRDGPDFESIGWFSESRIGIYGTPGPSEWNGYELPDDTYYMAISADGIWAAFDPDTGDVYDYGILIPDKDGYDLWYTVTSSGEFMTVWEFDYGFLITSKYGSLEYVYDD